MLQIVRNPGLYQVVGYGRSHHADQLSLVRAHFDLLATGPGLETARIGVSRPRGRGAPNHPTSAKGQPNLAPSRSGLAVCAGSTQPLSIQFRNATSSNLQNFPT